VYSSIRVRAQLPPLRLWLKPHPKSHVRRLSRGPSTIKRSNVNAVQCARRQFVQSRADKLAMAALSLRC
jgi:hypothetical protein